MKRFMLIFSFLYCSFIAFPQEFQKDMEAFRESIQLEKDGEYADAAAILKKSYKKDSYEYNLRLGWLDYLSGQYTESTTFYQKALTLKPMSIEARNGIVYPLIALGKTNEASKIYLEILDISPNETNANYRLGLIYYQQQKYKEAEKHLNRIINIYPFDYDTLVLLAWNYFQMGKSNEAKILFQKALLFKPDDESATQGLKLVN